LYDNNNKQITIPAAAGNSFSWIGPTGYSVAPQIGSSANNLIGCNIKKEDNNCYYGVLNCLIQDV
jgi:hypothetical protein